jgi:hypothetical protein
METGILEALQVFAPGVGFESNALPKIATSMDRVDI